VGRRFEPVWAHYHKLMHLQLFVRVVKALIRRIYWFLQKIFSLFGISILFLDQINFKQLRVSRFTPHESLHDFFTQLRPVNNGYELLRIGSNSDSGYLVPNDFDGISHCFSAGCDKNWTFELDLQKRFGIRSHLIDSEDKRPSDLTSEHTYTPKWLGSKATKNTLTLTDWVSLNSSDLDGDYILQMDIEGYEWLTLLNLDEKFFLKFRILIIEFHGAKNLVNGKHFNGTFKPIINQLTKLFDPVHIHGNNCCGVVTYEKYSFPEVFEVTLHRKDRAKQYKGYAVLPNGLDSRNLPEKDDLAVLWPW
jgi:hypothetical protein